MHIHAQRAFALVGPGRAGTTVAVALLSRGWVPVAVAGRAAGAASVRAASESLGAPAREIADAGQGAELVIVATPDAAIADTAAALAPGLDPGALVVHLSGACTLDELHKLVVARPDVAVGSLHPLQSMPTVELGTQRLAGSWCAVDGPQELDRIAVSLGMRPFRVDPSERARYHAAATVASNHLVALLGHANRIAILAGVPAEALLPLVRATIENIERLGPEDALTGPVERGDVDTVRDHLAALPAAELRAYRALAGAALRLTGREHPELVEALREDVA